MSGACWSSTNRSTGKATPLQPSRITRHATVMECCQLCQVSRNAVKGVLALVLPSNALHTAYRPAARAKAPPALSTEIFSLICSAPAPTGAPAARVHVPFATLNTQHLYKGIQASCRAWPSSRPGRSCSQERAPASSPQPGQPPLVLLGAAR